MANTFQNPQSQQTKNPGMNDPKTSAATARVQDPEVGNNPRKSRPEEAKKGMKEEGDNCSTSSKENRNAH